eukprot:CAMPEP_0117446152 /NCGR_PEP_ID=MMETSP0759-20121206/6178_1 /TAXON_ID=63605 /ORGANISM="Percolomonas cosmopolitus, Strain WS" /LENGTH=447 /DNA_ID=CAMNT_0005238379 /DNA_START=119 /DNA_END=1462 /DNA_ORIENTATION=+
MSYISREGALYLQQFPNTSYKFSVENKSLSEAFVLNSFWNWFTPRFIPECIAPNMVTFVGFMCVLGAWALQCIADVHPAMVVHPQSHLHSLLDFLATHCYLIMPILFFAYQTLDGCDGKQARRTKNSTPLGEILDHGVDAISASIFMYSLVYSLDKQYIFSTSPTYAPVGIGQYSDTGSNLVTHHNYFNMFSLLTQKAIFSRIFNWIYACSLQLVFAWAFFAAHVQHYHRSTFFMAELGACDLENLIIGCQLVRYFLGEKVFHFVLYEHWLVGQIDLGAAIVLIIILSTIGGVLQSVIDVLVNADRPRRQSMLLQFLPLIVYTLLGTFYVLNHPVIVAHNFVTYATTMTLPFGVILTTLNIARVTEQKMSVFGFQIFAGALVPLTLLNVNAWLQFCDESTLLFGVCMYCLVFYVHFASSIIGAFCGALKISFLSINPVPQAKAEKAQ